jgi:hypothetical protein
LEEADLSQLTAPAAADLQAVTDIGDRSTVGRAAAHNQETEQDASRGRKHLRLKAFEITGESDDEQYE